MEDSKPILRPFEPCDEDGVVDVWTACGLRRPWNDPSRDMHAKTAFQRDLFLVAELGSTIVGTVMAGYDGHRGWIYLLGVLPHHQGKGIGRALVSEAVRRLRDLGCWKVNLQVRESNLAVRSFYESLGFQDDHVIGMGLRLNDAPRPDSSD